MSRQRISRDPAVPDAPALASFLRGVERRGQVYAWLLSGSRDAGQRAVDWAVEQFRSGAGGTPFGDWPRRFWSLLLAAPALRRPPQDPHWEPRFEWLARLGHGPRAALLLRLVAGLAESDAAAVLGIARPAYRMGLQRALPHREDGEPDVQAWQALGEAARDLLRAPAEDAAAASVPAGPSAPGRPGTPGRGRRPAGRGLRALLWLVALLTVLALAATFLPLEWPPVPEVAPDGVLVEPLPTPEEPAERYPDAAALALHPDLALLLDAAEEDPAAADPAFHAWLLAEGEVDEAGQAGAGPHGSADPAEARPSAPSARARLEALDAAGRAALGQRRALWDSLAHGERGERRERWQAWQDLDGVEQALMRGAAARQAARIPDEAAALRARFDALDGSVRRGWLLGPDLGRDYGRLHPLIAQVPAEARVPLLDALRGLDAQARDDLAVLAARTPPQARAELRIGLLATPPAERARWLRRRVAGQ